MIWPPDVVAVLNHASREKAEGAAIGLADATVAALVPLNSAAASASPLSALAWPPATPAPAVASAKPIVSAIAVPDDSLSRQYEAAPSLTMSWPYADNGVDRTVT